MTNSPHQMDSEKVVHQMDSEKVVDVSAKCQQTELLLSFSIGECKTVGMLLAYFNWMTKSVN